MSRKLHKASMISAAAMIAFVIASAGGSGASAQNNIAAAANQQPITQTNPQLIVEPLPAEVQVPTGIVPAVETPNVLPIPHPIKAGSLAALVAGQPQPSELPRELHCLAGAIFFEAKSESLPGQLAVGRVIVARSKSGRFPNSYCGVVFQPSQFSFVRGRSMPAIPRASKQWKNAVAIAQIAHSNAWNSPVEGALYFHATYVSPGWKLRRVGRIDNHVFYR